MLPLSRRSFLTKSAELTAALAAAGACAPLVSRRAPRTTGFTSQGEEFTLAGGGIAVTWSAGRGGLRARRVTSGGESLASSNAAFALVLADGGSVSSETMHVVRGPTHESLAANSGASRLA